MPLNAAGTLDINIILLTSSWANTALFMGEICLAMYFLMHWRASRYQKLCIYPALFVDLAATCFGYLYVYTFVIIDHLQPDPLNVFWALPVINFGTIVNGATTEIFLIYRYWTLSRDRWLTTFLILVLITHLAFGFAVVIYSIVIPAATAPFSEKGAFVSCATSATIDITLAGGLVYAMRGHQTGLKSTQSIIKRVSAASVLCGFTTAACTTIGLILFALEVIENVFIFMCLGRIYTITTLFNFVILGRRKGAETARPRAVSTVAVGSLHVSPSRTSAAATGPPRISVGAPLSELRLTVSERPGNHSISTATTGPLQFVQPSTTPTDDSKSTGLPLLE